MEVVAVAVTRGVHVAMAGGADVAMDGALEVALDREGADVGWGDTRFEGIAVSVHLDAIVEISERLGLPLATDVLGDPRILQPGGGAPVETPCGPR